MPHAKLTIDLPEHIWIGDLSATHPELVFQVVTSIVGKDTGIGLIRLTATDPLPIITDIQARDDIDSLELLWKHDDEALLQIQTSNPPHSSRSGELAFRSRCRLTSRTGRPRGT